MNAPLPTTAPPRNPPERCLGLWTYQDLAQALHLHPRTVARMIKRLNLPVLRITHNTVRIEDHIVRRFLDVE